MIRKLALIVLISHGQPILCFQPDALKRPRKLFTFRHKTTPTVLNLSVPSLTVPPTDGQINDATISTPSMVQRREVQTKENFSSKITINLTKRLFLFLVAAAFVTKSFISEPNRRFGPMDIYHHLKPWKPVLVASIAIWQYVQHRQVKKRQALDATSEWGRYARNPGARGRALMALTTWVAVTGYGRARLWKWIGASKKAEQVLETSGQKLTTGLLQLGPLYIKLGQIISCRSNLLPAPWLKAMERLQDQVPAQKGDKAWALVRAVWPAGQTIGNTTFKSFEETFDNFNDIPIAAAR